VLLAVMMITELSKGERYSRLGNNDLLYLLDLTDLVWVYYCVLDNWLAKCKQALLGF
jgi:hypothetical protein